MSRSRKYNYLVAEDEFYISKIIMDMLNIHPSTAKIYTAKDGREALELFEEYEIDIIITDILMPNMTGIELIKSVHKMNPDTQIIVESAFSDIDLVREAMRNGAYDYVLKPFTIDDLMLAIDRLIERIKFIEEKKDYVTLLEKKVSETSDRLNRGFIETLSALVYALNLRDKYVHTHSLQVSKYSGIIGELLGLNEKQIDDLRTAGIVHDIGKIAVPDSVLQKPAKLTDEEYDLIKNHTIVGKNIIFSSMQHRSDIVDFTFHHHERFDGKGYPLGLKGENIPLPARIACLADSFDTMISNRVYKTKKTLDEAIEDIKYNMGKQFDPEISKIFLDWLEGKDEKNLLT